jgi:hypothetical protein
VAGGQQHPVPARAGGGRLVVAGLPLGPPQVVDQSADPAGGQGQYLPEIRLGGVRRRRDGHPVGRGRRLQPEVETERFGHRSVGGRPGRIGSSAG